MRAVPVAALLLVPALALAASAPAATARGLVAKVVAAYGGRAALDRARAVRQEGKVASAMRGKEGHLLRLFERPGSLRVEIAYPGDPLEVRVVHGGHGDRDGREVTGTMMHAAMVLQAARLALPLSLAEAGARVADRGAATRGDRTVRLLALEVQRGMELVAEVEPATGRIVRTTGSIPAGPGGRVDFATEYSDFRKVNGVLFAFHEESWASGQHTGATTLDKVEVLPSFPAGTFDEAL